MNVSIYAKQRRDGGCARGVRAKTWPVRYGAWRRERTVERAVPPVPRQQRCATRATWSHRPWGRSRRPAQLELDESQHRTIPEAVGALGLTEAAGRQRIARGRIAVTREGDRVYVHVDRDPVDVETKHAMFDGHDSGRVPIQHAFLQPTPPAVEAAKPIIASEGDQIAVTALERLLRDSLGRASTAEQAAAMWQERARNLEVQVEQLLALPAHEEEPARRWWRWWRR